MVLVVSRMEEQLTQTGMLMQLTRSCRPGVPKVPKAARVSYRQKVQCSDALHPLGRMCRHLHNNLFGGGMDVV